ncbi:hypothetical protein ACQ4LE_002812 [Meloidogyne hapla]|uniref:Uncharacterized protein n=2 Tax=Meloidogyne hapla TaxID=6305 RepID=A0A1I8BDQ1_MELHA
MFNERILKNLLSLCIDANIYNNQPTWKDWFCVKANRIQTTLNSIIIPTDRTDFQVNMVFESLAKYFRGYYFDNKNTFCINHIVPEKIDVLKGKINGMVKYKNDQELHELNDHIEESIDKGFKLKIGDKKKPKNDKNQSNNKAIELGCEITIAIQTLCEKGSPVDCYSLKSALSIFAAEMFLASIFIEDFDYLVGKWPIAIYKNSGRRRG